MKKKIAKLLAIFVFSALLAGIFFFAWPKSNGQEDNKIKALNAEIENLLISRRKTQLDDSVDVDLFGDDGIARLLLIGVDARVGQNVGNCDAIQMFEIDKNNQSVQITAVPRGTFAMLRGKGYEPSDYYVSNSCRLEGLEYGIEQMEKILGKKADYVVLVGFSEVLGILKRLDLPATETLQWLRQRQGYAVGEPQRARNHSTFLKQMLVKFIPEDHSRLDAVWHYLIYRLVHTDLSFKGVEEIINVLIDMDLKTNPEKISLSMKPAYEVQDIAYDPENLDDYFYKMLDPVKDYIPEHAYVGATQEEVENNLLNLIAEKINDPDFARWGFENHIWLQIQDENKATKIQYDLTIKYVALLNTLEKKESVLADYILEMEYLGFDEYTNKGKLFLADLIKVE